MDLHGKGVLPLNEQVRRDWGELDFEVTVIVGTPGEILIRRVCIDVIEPDLNSVKVDNDTIITEDPAIRSYDRIDARENEGMPEVGGRILVPGTSPEANLRIFIIIAITQFGRSTRPL